MFLLKTHRIILTAILCVLLSTPALMGGKDDPEWVRTGKSSKFSADLYMQAMGVASASGDEEKDRQRAEYYALVKIIQEIKVDLSSDFTVVDEEKMEGGGGSSTSKAEEITSAKAKLTIQGVGIRETYVKKNKKKKAKTYYALAVLDRKVAGEHLKSQIEELNSAFAKNSGNGKKFVEEKNYYEAIKFFQKAVSNLSIMASKMSTLRIIYPNDPDRESFEKTLTELSAKSDISSTVSQILTSDEAKKLDIIIGGFIYRLYDTFGAYAENTSVAIGYFRYQDSRISSPFSKYIKDKIESELSSVNDLRIIGAATVENVLRSKGVAYDGTPQKLASLCGADALIQGNYWEFQDRIELKATIIAKGTGENLGSTSIDIPKNVIPLSINLKPDNFNEVMNQLAYLSDESTDSDLKVTIWTDRGDGAVYQDQDPMYVHIKANMECFVRVVYNDAAGNNIQIFPNAYSKSQDGKIVANQVVRIPGEDDNFFHFTISEPFGTETMKVFASTVKLPPDPSAQILPNGLILLGDTKDVVQNARGISIGSEDVKTKRAEASCSLTTVGK